MSFADAFEPNSCAKRFLDEFSFPMGEYLTSLFCNPYLSSEEFRENKDMWPRIKNWIVADPNTEVAQYLFTAMGRSYNDWVRGMSMIDNSDYRNNLHKWDALNREFLIFDKSWEWLFEELDELFTNKEFYMADTESGDKRYCVGWLMAQYIRNMDEEMCEWFYDTYKNTVDEDGDEFCEYGLEDWITHSPYCGLDVIDSYITKMKKEHGSQVIFSYEYRTRLDAQVLGWNSHLTVEWIEKHMKEHAEDDLELMRNTAQTLTSNPFLSLEVVEEAIAKKWFHDTIMEILENLRRNRNLTYDFFMKDDRFRKYCAAAVGQGTTPSSYKVYGFDTY